MCFHVSSHLWVITSILPYREWSCQELCFFRKSNPYPFNTSGLNYIKHINSESRVSFTLQHVYNLSKRPTLTKAYLGSLWGQNLSNSQVLTSFHLSPLTRGEAWSSVRNRKGNVIPVRDLANKGWGESQAGTWVPWQQEWSQSLGERDGHSPGEMILVWQLFFLPHPGHPTWLQVSFHWHVSVDHKCFVL